MGMPFCVTPVFQVARIPMRDIKAAKMGFLGLDLILILIC